MSKLRQAVSNYENDSTNLSATDVIETKVDELEKESHLVSATETRLEKLFGEPTLSSTSEGSIESSVVSTSIAESAAESTIESSESTESAVESTESSVVVSAAALKDNLYRAAIHQGWKHDEIREFFNKDPNLAEKTFSKIYESTNKLSQEFAALGRAKLSKESKKEPAKKEPGEQKSKFEEIDIDKLRKEYDNDPIVELIAQQQKQNKLLFERLEKTPEPKVESIDKEQLQRQLQEDAAIETQIDGFFAHSDMTTYKDFYGEVPKGSRDWNMISTEQKSNRWKLLELADGILVGAETQGRTMNVDEAMQLAHLVVSEPVRNQKIRDDIKAKAVKRGKSLSLKPISGKPLKGKRPETAKELETVTAQRLAKVFGR